MFSRKIWLKAAWMGLSALLFCASAQSAPLDLRNVPLYLLSRANPNVLLNMSVETPMGGAAYADQVGNPTGCAGRVDNPFSAVVNETSATSIGKCYSAATEFRGYFNPNKCYNYNSAQGYFEIHGDATDRACTNRWSGNFLNWATMTAIDMFIQTMTGGNRVTDTTALTVIQRARKHDNNSWFPIKAISNGLNSTTPASVTGLASPPNRLFIANTATGFKLATTYASVTSGTPDFGTFNARVRVCDKTKGNEANCVSYGSGASSYYKPEGLIQGNSRTKRFAVLSYTFDNTPERGGGVIRSNMKYVGPVLPDGSANPRKEYGTDGLLISDPDASVGAGGLYETQSDGLNSGVINYVNKFSDVGYKSYDPIGELFYEGIRYFKNLDPTPEYSGADNHTSPALTAITKNNTDARCGGFWFANTGAQWEDPIQYRCQKNFIVAINDANPWLDKRLPGTSFLSSSISGATGFQPFNLASGDYGEPSNADSDINVTSLTNRVGALEGINTTWAATGNWTSGTFTGQNDSVGGGAGTWDNSCSTAKAVQLGEVMGTCPATSKQNSYYVAGLAYYANTTDLRSDFANDRGKQTISSFIIDTQEFNSNPLDGPHNMLWLAGKYGGFVDADQDGVPDNAAGDVASEWDTNADGAPDNYVLATQPSKLIEGLNRAFEFIDSQDTSAASASVNAGSISSDTRVYQAKFNSGDWTGELLSLPVTAQATADAEEGSVLDDEWANVQMIPAHDSRKIFTIKSDKTPVSFEWSLIGSTRRSQLLGADATEGEQRLNYLRGDPSKERKNNGPYRTRNKRLGDIINSAPLYVGKPPFLYTESSYIAFREANDTAAERPPMIYVGANDGMLHAINASTGIEQFAFIPGAVFRKLHHLTSPNYDHQYFVDGSPTMGDAYFGGAWHTMLVGGLNKGGQGIYALDVTDPDQDQPKNMYKWEFTDADDADLGYTFSRPAIIKVRDGTGTAWVAAFGNGYNNTEDDTAAGGQKSSTGDAALYFVNISTGVIHRKIEIPVGTEEDPLGFERPNGLGTPAFVDLNGDTVVDYAYAGDLFGNLWKFDLRDGDKTKWEIAFDGAPLFVAKDKDDKVQPITSRLEVARGPENRGMMVLFGTGKFLEPSDRDVAQLSTQSVYGIIDPNTADTDPVGERETDLTQQAITDEFVGTFKRETGKDADGKPVYVDVKVPVRVSTQNAITNRGWYMDLLSGTPGVPEPSGFKGEMMVSDPIVRNKRLIFTTLIPNPDPCDFGGTSWLMEIDALTGGRLKETPFDLNGDGLFDSGDYVIKDGKDIPVSGRQSEVGIIPRPGVLASETAEYKYTPGTSGNMQVIRENPGAGDVGRQSWRQLR
jgi:type IV pilus assembly protein PilY1